MSEMILVKAARLPGRPGRMAFRLLETFAERLRGLLGTTEDALPVALARCSSIHTFGMRYRLDVAFLDGGGRVLGAWTGVPPGRLLARRTARLALERPHRHGPWLVEGERVCVVGPGWGDAGGWRDDERRDERHG